MNQFPTIIYLLALPVSHTNNYFIWQSFEPQYLLYVYYMRELLKTFQNKRQLLSGAALTGWSLQYR